ncbi:uncharacterized protein N7511_002919 [Penicillium nucicola]|uniref:uncharacterized protein n=1 Tax=Penicillium nucicola TaxID=1850975 RepID=UPI0025451387|nr:uncharacterized protein N7511_002919 [Penicillium nucicola]KAJ5770868.1 hypothetical protein N7511_002919 [Penicillium nucicola]
MEELREKAKFYQETKMVLVLDSTHTVVKSDLAVSPQLQQSLQQGVHELERCTSHEKYWTFDSNGMVVDLLHPSIFPLFHGVSRALPYGNVPIKNCILSYSGTGEIVKPEFMLVKNSDARDHPYGTFQWLPSNLAFTAGGQTKLMSYVNNIHPVSHAPLYNGLEAIVDATIPLWNECLSWLDYNPRIERIRGLHCPYQVPDDCHFSLPVLDDDGVPSENKTREVIYEDAKEVVGNWASAHPDQFDPNIEARLEDWYKQHRVLKESSPVPFCSRESRISKMRRRPMNLKSEFNVLQVSFKLTNIHLTPESPEYEGGSWDTDGSLNDHICASAIYYYEEENIIPTHLDFQQHIDSFEAFFELANTGYVS